MKGFFQRFFYGRYGTDHLGRFLIGIYFALFLLYSVTHTWVYSRIFYNLAMLVILYALFRMMSRNVWNRQKENAWYLQKTQRIRSYLSFQRQKFRDRKTYSYQKCPHCKATIRLPRKKGKHTVCCPKCLMDFEVKIR